jgi:hypothetical protein
VRQIWYVFYRHPFSLLGDIIVLPSSEFLRAASPHAMQPDRFGRSNLGASSMPERCPYSSVLSTSHRVFHQENEAFSARTLITKSCSTTDSTGLRLHLYTVSDERSRSCRLTRSSNAVLTYSAISHESTHVRELIDFSIPLGIAHVQPRPTSVIRSELLLRSCRTIPVNAYILLMISLPLCPTKEGNNPHSNLDSSCPAPSAASERSK